MEPYYFDRPLDWYPRRNRIPFLRLHDFPSKFIAWGSTKNAPMSHEKHHTC